MKASEIQGCTRRLGAPTNWDHESAGICHTLEIVDTPDGWMISAWKPTDKELELLNAGKHVLLFIQGVAHPVVSVEVEA